MEFYESVSEDAMAILEECSDVLRAVSIDEAYLDVTERTNWSVAEGFARHVKQRIDEEVGVTASVGVAPNMSTAKIASDHDKPDGLVVVEPEEVRSFLEPLDIDQLHGIGPVTAGELRADGIDTVGELAGTDESTLVDQYGDRGRELWRRARGIDGREVTPVGRPKSLSRESAFPEAVEDPSRKREQLEALASAVADRARRKGALYRTIGIKVVTPPYDVNTRARSLPGPVDDPDLVGEVALELLEEFADDPVRKVGVRLGNLSFSERDQSDLGEWDGATSATGREGREGQEDPATEASGRGQTSLADYR